MADPQKPERYYKAAKRVNPELKSGGKGYRDTPRKDWEMYPAGTPSYQREPLSPEQMAWLAQELPKYTEAQKMRMEAQVNNWKQQAMLPAPGEVSNADQMRDWWDRESRGMQLAGNSDAPTADQYAQNVRANAGRYIPGADGPIADLARANNMIGSNYLRQGAKDIGPSPYNAEQAYTNMQNLRYGLPNDDRETYWDKQYRTAQTQRMSEHIGARREGKARYEGPKADAANYPRNSWDSWHGPSLDAYSSDGRNFPRYPGNSEIPLAYSPDGTMRLYMPNSNPPDSPNRYPYNVNTESSYKTRERKLPYMKQKPKKSVTKEVK